MQIMTSTHIIRRENKHRRSPKSINTSSEFDFEDERDMKLLNKIDAKVRKHAKAVEILEQRTRKLRREYFM